MLGGGRRCQSLYGQANQGFCTPAEETDEKCYCNRRERLLGSSLILKLMENGIHAVAIDISFENSRLPQSGYITKIEMELDSIAELSQAIPKMSMTPFIISPGKA